MKIVRYAKHCFLGKEDLSFSAEEYSKFKFGSKRVSGLFGRELGKSFAKDLHITDELKKESTSSIIVSSAPYKYIPVASTILKDYFISEFNAIWTRNNEPVVDLKITRGHSYNTDYGSLSSEERDKAISSDNFYIDKEIIKDKTLIFIDDIRITGSHEKRMLSLLNDANFDGTVFFVYYAALVGDVSPTIENDLNFAFVKSLLDVDWIIKNDKFQFNTRVTKYILSANEAEFKSFIQYQSDIFRQTLKSYAMGNGYHKQEDFMTNFNFLNSLVL